MKTILLAILLASLPVYAQFSFGTTDSGPVTLINRAGDHLDLFGKTNLVIPAFTNAISLYKEALASHEHPLKTTIGIFKLQPAIALMENIQLVIVLLPEGDDLEVPTTWPLLNFSGKPGYVLKIPHKFMLKADGDRISYLALHELAHRIVGKGIHTGEAEEERRVEYVVSLVVGKERYSQFVLAWLSEKDPGKDEKSLKEELQEWLKYIGVKD